MKMPDSVSLQELSPLFEDVQVSRVFPDSKTFVDCIPNSPPADILSRYMMEKAQPGFMLESFVRQHFTLPVLPVAEVKGGKPILKHIADLWEVLTRVPSREVSSLIHLPYPYVVPGGRFGEIYYWDSYFTMLGLRATGREDLIVNMVRNFAYLIDRYGYIPNGNRTYFLGRSQPPFFSLMVSLLQEEEQVKYLGSLEKEYAFWMREPDVPELAKHRAVRLPDGVVLNRYWDELHTPRPEAHLEDIELAHSAKDAAKLYRHIRAAAESGWDFSTRWFSDASKFSSIHTTDFVPVDLNCLLYHAETVIAGCCHASHRKSDAIRYEEAAASRKAAIRKYHWNADAGFFCDYDLTTNAPAETLTLAGLFPLFVHIARKEQASIAAEVVKSRFLKPGGLTTSLAHSGQQWDAPNGWAPLQWVSSRGLLNYGHAELASEIRSRWMHTVEAVYERTGKLTEKYDVWNASAEASGGEYPNQDGFGWTNGVYAAFESVGR